LGCRNLSVAHRSSTFGLLLRAYGSTNIKDVTTNKKLIKWVEENQKLFKPKNVRILSGSQEEYDELCEQLIKGGTMERLNQKKRPNSFLGRTDPGDVARYCVSFHTFSSFDSPSSFHFWGVVLCSPTDPRPPPSSALRRRMMPAPRTTGWLPTR